MTKSQSKGRELSPTENGRVFVGLAVQPFILAFVALVTFPVLDYTGRLFIYGPSATSLWEGAGPMAVVVGFVALGVTILGAVPLLAIQLTQGPVSRDRVLASGLALGNVPTILMLMVVFQQQLRNGGPLDVAHIAYGPIGLVRVLLFGSILGVIGALVFWWIAGASIGTISNNAG